MADKAWADWYDAVIPALPGLPTGAPADYFIKRAAIEFFDRSCAWRAAIPAFEATINVGTYTLAAPLATTQVVKVLELRFQGRELLHRSPAWLKEKYGQAQDWRNVSAPAPTYWTSEGANKVTIVPKPTATVADALAGWAAIKPTEAATGIDEWLYRDYHDEIADLAVARAAELERRPYSNAREAQRRHSKVNTSIGLIAYELARGRGDGPYRTKTHWI